MIARSLWIIDSNVLYMFMNNIETLTPSTFICLPKVTVLWLMIISLFLLQFYNIYNMYYLFSVLVLTMVYLVLSQVFVELHTVLSLPMSDTDIAVICDTWIKSLHIFLRSRFFFTFFFFICLPKSKSHVNHFEEFSFRFCWLFMLLSNSFMRIYGTKKLIHLIFPQSMLVSM